VAPYISKIGVCMAGKNKKEEKRKSDDSVNSVVSELEKDMFSLKFYPVAVDEKTKDEAVAKIKERYKKGNETVRQLVLYMLHESIAEFFEFRIMHNFEYMKNKNPNAEPARMRIEIYKKMFNYNTSIEGITAMIGVAGELEGDDSAKLLTYHYARLCSWESEASIMMRNAIIDALGKSDSLYGFSALMEYAKNTDNEKTYHRLVRALGRWSEKLSKIKMPDAKKRIYLEKLRNILAKEFRGRHYG